MSNYPQIHFALGKGAAAVWLAGALFSATQAFAQDYLHPEETCGPGRREEVLYKTVLPKKPLPKTHFSQGDAKSCYFFSGLFQLQTFHNFVRGSSSEELSAGRAYAAGECDPNSGGHSHEALSKLRKKFGKKFPVEPALFSLNKFVESYRGLKESTSDCLNCCRFVKNQILSPGVIDLITNESKIDDHIAQKLRTTSAGTTPGQIFDDLPGDPSKWSDLRDFNIHLGESIDENLQPKSEKTVSEEIRKILEFTPPTPVEFNYCHYPGGDQCNVSHSIILTGAKEKCCIEEKTGSKECNVYWKVANWWDGRGEGWLRATGKQGLIEAHTRFPTEYSYIRPCRPPDEAKEDTKEAPPQEECKPWIMGPHPFHNNSFDPMAIQYLLQSGHESKLDEPAEGKLTPLMEACSLGALESVRLLVAAGADIHKRDDVNKFDAILFASENSHPSVVNYLVEQGANVNSKSPNGNTPLISAASQGALDTVKLLLKKGANLNALSKTGESALSSAILANRVEVALFLLNEKGINVQSKDKFGQSPLHLAAAIGNLTLVKELQNRGADLNGSSLSGMTPILTALAANKKDIAEYLLEQKTVDVRAQSEEGWGLQHFAADSGDVKLLEYLHKRNLNLDQETKDGMTALSVAAAEGQMETCEYLLKQGAKIEGGKSPVTPLLRAISKGHASLARVLLSKGADAKAEAMPKRITTLYHLTRSLDDLELFKELVALGADPEVESQDGHDRLNLVHVASGKGRMQLIQYFRNALFKQKWHKLVNKRSSVGKWAPLHFAVKGGHLPLTKYLLTEGADINRKTGNGGDTPLNLAAEFGNQEIVKYLIRKNADAWQSNLKGDFPDETAEQAGFQEIATMIRKYRIHRIRPR